MYNNFLTSIEISMYMNSDPERFKAINSPSAGPRNTGPVFLMPEKSLVINGQKRCKVNGSRTITNDAPGMTSFREFIVGYSGEETVFMEYNDFTAQKITNDSGQTTYVRDLGGEIYEHFTPPVPEIFEDKDGRTIELNISDPQDISAGAEIEFFKHGESGDSIQQRAVRLMVMNAKISGLAG